MSKKKIVAIAGVIAGAFVTGVAAAVTIGKVRRMERETKMLKEFLESIGEIPEEDIDDFIMELDEDLD